MLPGGLNYPHRYIRLIVHASSAERVYVEKVSDATWWAELPPQGTCSRLYLLVQQRVYVEQVSAATWWAELPPQVRTVDCTC
jgi:hypothetical protein